MDQMREVVIRDYQATSTKLYKISLMPPGAQKVKEYVRYIFLSLITLSIYYFLDRGIKPTEAQVAERLRGLLSNAVEQKVAQSRKILQDRILIITTDLEAKLSEEKDRANKERDKASEAEKLGNIEKAKAMIATKDLEEAELKLAEAKKAAEQADLQKEAMKREIEDLKLRVTLLEGRLRAVKNKFIK